MADERKPNPIIRREKFIVDHTEINDYEDLLVTSQSGRQYKIGKKRENLFAVFQPGTEVVVGYAVYKDREYIAEATPSAQVVSTATPIETEKVKPQEQVKSNSYWGETPEERIIKRRSIERQVSLERAVEMVGHILNNVPAGTKGDIDVLGLADAYFNWISKGEMPQPIAKDTSPEESAKTGQIEHKSDKEATFDNLKSAGSTLPIFKMGSELVSYAAKHGMKLVDIKAKLGYDKSPNEIADIAAATKVLFPEGVK